MASNVAAASPSLLDEPVDYRDLKEWIAQQEIHPKPLTPLQQRAIADLKRSLEPDIGDRDWVSLLNLFKQASGAASEFKEDLADNGGWAYQCTLKLNAEAEQMVFPNLDAGFVPGETGTPCAPGFARKKDAKQYAAKCCIEWLMANGHMPSDGKSVTFPKSKAKPAAKAVAALKKQAASANGNTNGTTTTTTSTTKVTPKKRPHSPSQDTTPTNTTNPIDITDEDILATQRVTHLCQQLGITPPQYRITPSTSTTSTTSDSSGAAYFDGYPDFGADSVKVPDGLGRVASVYGKKNARERIAEEVLAWLVAEEKRRGEELAGLLALTQQMLTQQAQQAGDGNGDGEEGVALKGE
ncbi:hypothetical protein C8A03DRAFT_34657 [Achaetomium macrosporum]|uniref:Uncharacterized protein n=1 Tax=Achaetomium macrosporum TaxID=79813 RepID=A0AAN7HDF5_9PEZI|nr:hypothetical protein C8A03DRAFT_34657 [Achaetomium macrosporum]